MKKTLNESQFIDEWRQWEDRKDQFSYGALKALFAWYEEYEESTGEEMELDIVAICCDWAEYDTCEEYAREFFDFEGMTYDEDGAEELTPDEVEEKAREFLEERTTVLEAQTPQVTDSGLSYVTSYVIMRF